MSEKKNSNGFKLKFNTAQLIIIIGLIISLAVTLTTRAGNEDVNAIKTDLKTKASEENVNALETDIKLINQRQDLQYKEIIEHLKRIEGRLERIERIIEDNKP